MSYAHNPANPITTDYATFKEVYEAVGVTCEACITQDPPEMPPTTFAAGLAFKGLIEKMVANANPALAQIDAFEAFCATHNIPDGWLAAAAAGLTELPS